MNSKIRKLMCEADFQISYDSNKLWLIEGEKKLHLRQAVVMIQQNDHHISVGSMTDSPVTNAERLRIFASVSNVRNKRVLIISEKIKFFIDSKKTLERGDWLFVAAIIPNRGSMLIAASGDTIAYPSGISVLTSSGLELIQTAANILHMLRPTLDDEKSFDLLEDFCIDEEEDEDDVGGEDEDYDDEFRENF